MWLLSTLNIPSEYFLLICTISDGKARTSHLCCSVAVLWVWRTLKDRGHSVDWKGGVLWHSLGCEHRWLPSCILGVLRNMARRSGIMNWPLISQMTGPSLFGGLDSGLDCGTGLRESCAHHFGWVNRHRKYTASNFFFCFVYMVQCREDIGVRQ